MSRDTGEPAEATSLGSITARDGALLRALRLRALHEHPEAFAVSHDEEAAKPESFWDERAASGVASDNGVTIVARRDGALVAMSTLVRNGLAKMRHGAGLFAVYVAPEARSARLGDRVVGACLAHSDAIGIDVVRLSVATSNAAAIRLYLRCGFRVYGVESKTLVVDGAFVDELLMERHRPAAR
ncbi:MAG: GNAT family N-acetyltransferase [Myxococcales bacterium]|nr:GNAT family N-acetyltransferase [Myxococcales bacterium]